MVLLFSNHIFLLEEEIGEQCSASMCISLPTIRRKWHKYFALRGKALTLDKI